MSGIGNLGGSLPPIITTNDPPKADGTDPNLGTNSTNSATTVSGSATDTAPILSNVPIPAVTTAPSASSPLDRPQLTLPASVTGSSMGDLIEMIQDEIQKTSDALANIQKIQISEDSKKQQAANKDQIEKLNSAADQIEQAQEMKDDMADVEWAMLALSCVVALFTFGATMGPIIAGLTALTQVPIEGQNLMGWVTTGVGDGLAELEKGLEDFCEATGIVHKSSEELTADGKSIDDTKNYQAMALMTYLTIAISIISIAVTFGGAAPEAASADAELIGEDAEVAANEVVSEIVEEVEEEASESVSQSLKSAMDAAKQGLSKAKDTVTDLMAESKQAQRIYNAVTTSIQTAGSLVTDGMSIDKSILEYENANNQADADKIKAYTKFLEKMLAQEESFLKEILDAQSNIAETVKDILQTEHSTNLHIANLTTHA
jgi:hypothetical protein